jgi:hypothetical protein
MILSSPQAAFLPCRRRTPHSAVFAAVASKSERHAQLCSVSRRSVSGLVPSSGIEFMLVLGMKSVVRCAAGLLFSAVLLLGMILQTMAARSISSIESSAYPVSGNPQIITFRGTPISGKGVSAKALIFLKRDFDFNIVHLNIVHLRGRLLVPNVTPATISGGMNVCSLPCHYKLPETTTWNTTVQMI